jgi:hypothetical protein
VATVAPLGGWTRSLCAPKGCVVSLRAGGEDGGSQPRPPPQGARENPEARLTPPVRWPPRTRWSAGHSFQLQPSAGRFLEPFPMYRLVYRPEAVRHPTRSKPSTEYKRSRSRLTTNQARRHRMPFFARRTNPQESLLTAPLFPFSSFSRSLRFPYRPSVDEVTQIDW